MSIQEFNLDSEGMDGVYSDAPTLAEVYADLEQEGSDKWDEWISSREADQEFIEFGCYSKYGRTRSGRTQAREQYQQYGNPQQTSPASGQPTRRRPGPKVAG